MTAILQAVLGAGIGALAAYVAIRSDLASLTARMNLAEKSIDKAHDRIDAAIGK